MDMNIMLLLLQSFFRMASSRMAIFFEVILTLFILTIPLGYMIIKYFRFFEENDLHWYDRISLALGIGTGAIILLSFFTMFIKFNAVLICSEILLIDLLLLYVCLKNKLLFGLKKRSRDKPAKNNIKHNKYAALIQICALIFLIIMFSYYSLMPLTNDMALFRDYDLFALGIQQNSDMKLPFYGIDIYYPPGTSILAATLNLAFPEVNIHKFMFNLSYLFMFYLFVLFYQLGNVGFKNKFLGFFFMVAFALSAPSRNLVTGGGAPPSTISTAFCLTFLILILRWFKNHSNKNIYLSGLILAAAALTHIDALLLFLCGFVAMIAVHTLFDLKNYKKFIYAFIKIGILSLLLVSPFLINSFEGKQKIEKIWTDSMWENYAHTEIHPKPLPEILFFSGRWVFYIFLLSIPYLIFKYCADGKIEKPILFILLWTAIILSTNNFIFLRIARHFILFYPLNIMMWYGTAVVFSLGAGFGLYFLLDIFLRRYDSKLAIALFLAAMMILTFVKIADYETYNKENVFNTQGGFVKSCFANRNDFYNSGDVYLTEWLVDNKIKSAMVQGGYFGWAFPSATKIRPDTIFVNMFYDNPDQIGEITEEGRINNEVYFDYLNETSLFENFSHIFLQSSYGTSYYSESLLEGGRYDIIKRKDGAKILRPNLENFKSPPKEKNLVHAEAEDFSTNSSKRTYIYGGMIDLTTVEMPLNSAIRIDVSDINQNKSRYILYIKYLTFVVPLPILVEVGGRIYKLKKTSDKMAFSESEITFLREELAKSNFSIVIVGDSQPLNFLGNTYNPEVDWIELEAISAP